MSKQTTQQLRIIGGQWRSRRLTFPNIEGLRPTLDRVRETVFNWLQCDIENKVIIDAFAGSGALGLEALSRGAKQAVFIEKNPAAAKQLSQNLALLNADNAQVLQTDALTWLQQFDGTADVVFLDPPFAQNLLQPSLELLAHKLTRGSLIYIEHEPHLKPVFPSHWQERKQKATKEFIFRLFEVL